MRRIEYLENNTKKIKDLELDEEFTEEEYELVKELRRKLEIARLLLRLQQKLNITQDEMTLLKEILR